MSEAKPFCISKWEVWEAMKKPHRRSRILLWAFLVPVILLSGCSHPSDIAMDFDLATRPPGLAVITVKVRNQETRPTTPLAVDVSIQTKSGSDWGPDSSVLHPAAFVLNKKEEQILRATLKLQGEAIRATVTIKEQETGRVLSSKKFEKVFSKS